MRMHVVVFVLTAAFLNGPASAHARIAMNRARIVSIMVIEDDKRSAIGRTQLKDFPDSLR